MPKNHKKRGFVVCVRNDGHDASPELRKIYEVMADVRGSRHKLLRVVDESGEDYLYPEDYFLAISLPQPIQKVLMHHERFAR
ncbi:MAG TPA: hypothetical protein VFD30_20035 [Terriglobia bacterium]|nr:hypothetical protein [Terriglobia bacterium]